MRIELSSDTVVQGETVWAKLIFRNDSDKKDSIAYFNSWEILAYPMILKSDKKDTTWKCNDLQRTVQIQSHYAKTPYTVFKPGEEKYCYSYFTKWSYMCADNNASIIHYLFPSNYKVSAHIYSGCNKFEELRSMNTLDLVITDSDNDAFNDLEIENADNSKFSSEGSVDSIINYYNGRIEKYKNSAYEKEFFLKKLHYLSIKGQNAYLENYVKEALSETEEYISTNPDSPQNHAMLDYYKLFRFLFLKDIEGTTEYLKDLQLKYPGKRIAIMAKEYLERKY